MEQIFFYFQKKMSAFNEVFLEEIFINSNSHEFEGFTQTDTNEEVVGSNGDCRDSDSYSHP